MTFEYSPAPESRAVVDIAPHYGLFIDGDFVETIDGTTFKTINPATEEILGVAADASAADVEKAIAAARRAFDTTDWSTNVELRQRCLSDPACAITTACEPYRVERRIVGVVHERFEACVVVAGEMSADPVNIRVEDQLNRSVGPALRGLDEEAVERAEPAIRLALGDEN